jgi:hypothetical protein
MSNYDRWKRIALPTEPPTTAKTGDYYPGPHSAWGKLIDLNWTQEEIGRHGTAHQRRMTRGMMMLLADELELQEFPGPDVARLLRIFSSWAPAVSDPPSDPLL